MVIPKPELDISIIPTMIITISITTIIDTRLEYVHSVSENRYW